VLAALLPTMKKGVLPVLSWKGKGLGKSSRAITSLGEERLSTKETSESVPGRIPRKLPGQRLALRKVHASTGKKVLRAGKGKKEHAPKRRIWGTKTHSLEARWIVKKKKLTGKWGTDQKANGRAFGKEKPREKKEMTASKRGVPREVLRIVREGSA